jgi:hypothetical protein
MATRSSLLEPKTTRKTTEKQQWWDYGDHLALGMHRQPGGGPTRHTRNQWRQSSQELMLGHFKGPYLMMMRNALNLSVMIYLMALSVAETVQRRWMTNWKGFGRKRQWCSMRRTYCPRLCLEGLGITTENLNRETWFTSRDSNPEMSPIDIRKQQQQGKRDYQLLGSDPPCNLVDKDKFFGENCCLHLQSRSADFFEMLVPIYQTARRRIPEYIIISEWRDLFATVWILTPLSWEFSP